MTALSSCCGMAEQLCRNDGTVRSQERWPFNGDLPDPGVPFSQHEIRRSKSMTDNIIMLLYLGLLYFVGFMVPVAARTAQNLANRACGCVVLVFVCAALSNSPIIFPIIFVLGPLALGAVPGFVTGSALLALDWGPGTRMRAAAIITGLAALPVSAGIYSAYSDWRSSAVYASLPTSETLPRIPACEPFRSAGPLLSTVIYAPPDQQKRAPLPFSFEDIPVRYPAAYVKYAPPRFPVEGRREQYQIFEMYIGDARSLPREEERNADGNLIPRSSRSPSVLFRFEPRPPIAEFAPRHLRSAGKDVSLTEGVGGASLAATPYPDLQVVEPVKPDLSEPPGKDYVRVRNSSIEELLQCDHGGFAEMCKFYLDESGLTIGGQFPNSSLADWPTIQRNVRSFTECSVVAAKR